jgi:hypothetical protein
MKQMFWVFALLALVLIAEGAKLIGSFNGCISLWGAFLFMTGVAIIFVLWRHSKDFNH